MAGCDGKFKGLTRFYSAGPALTGLNPKKLTQGILLQYVTTKIMGKNNQKQP
jgi:hypothetical protein